MKVLSVYEIMFLKEVVSVYTVTMQTIYDNSRQNLAPMYHEHVKRLYCQSVAGCIENKN